MKKDMKGGVRTSQTANSLHTFALCLMRVIHFVWHLVKWEWTAFKWQGIMFGGRNFAKSHWDSSCRGMVNVQNNEIALSLPFTLASLSMSKFAHCVLIALAACLKQSGLREYVCNASNANTWLIDQYYCWYHMTLAEWGLGESPSRSFRRRWLMLRWEWCDEST
jgi:hypothetical protein